MNLFYKVWADLIMHVRSLPDNRDSWKLLTLTVMSFIMGINFCMTMTVVERYLIQRSFYDLELDILPTQSLNGTLAFILLYFAPMALINYLLIFRDKRYELLIAKYKMLKPQLGQGKLFLRFLLIGAGIPVFTLTLGMLFVWIWP